jgi:hypothetical protein
LNPFGNNGEAYKAYWTGGSCLHLLFTHGIQCESIQIFCVFWYPLYVELTLDLNNQPRGKGLWKFNNALLKDNNYMDIIKSI